MKNALDWIKSNPISVASAVVAFIGFVLLLYFYFLAAGNFRTEKAELLKGPEAEQKALLANSVPIPSEDPNAEPTDEPVVINATVISQVREIYDTIQSQSNSILNATSGKNKSRHWANSSQQSVLLARGAIWPTARDDFQYEQAKADYLKQHKILLMLSQDEGWNMPSMRASSPPRDIEIQRALAQTAFNFVSSIGVTSTNELNQEQANQLYAEQRTVLMSLLTKRAGQIHIYASLPPEEDVFAPKEDDPETNPNGGLDAGLGEFGVGVGSSPLDNQTQADYPFRLMPWAFASGKPNPDEVWEGQVQLWITRDIMHAIHKTNRVGQVVEVTQPDGSVVQADATVLNSPIKRLLALEVVPGYVGLHTTGGIAISQEDLGRSSNTTGSSPADIPIVIGSGDRSGGGARSFSTPEFTDTSSENTGERPSVYPTPASTLAPLPVTEEAPEHFGITPTGRVSNSVFDVRHTRLVIDIQWKDLPAFIEELNNTNFMTIIQLRLDDIDEYEVLREGGYIYGSEDVVRAELVIESLWFRNWTEAIMPKSVKDKLLIPEEDPNDFP